MAVAPDLEGCRQAKLYRIGSLDNPDRYNAAELLLLLAEGHGGCCTRRRLRAKARCGHSPATGHVYMAGG